MLNCPTAEGSHLQYFLLVSFSRQCCAAFPSGGGGVFQWIRFCFLQPSVRLPQLWKQTNGEKEIVSSILHLCLSTRNLYTIKLKQALLHTQNRAPLKLLCWCRGRSLISLIKDPLITIRIVGVMRGENKTFVLLTYYFYLPLEPFAQLHYIFRFGSRTICKWTQSSPYKVGCGGRVACLHLLQSWTSVTFHREPWPSGKCKFNI